MSLRALSRLESSYLALSLTSTLVTTMGEVEVALPPFLLQETAALRIAGVVTLQADPRSFGMLLHALFLPVGRFHPLLGFPGEYSTEAPGNSTCAVLCNVHVHHGFCDGGGHIGVSNCHLHDMVPSFHCFQPATVCVLLSVEAGNVCVGDHRQLGCREGQLTTTA